MREDEVRQLSPLETGAPDDELVEELARAVLRERNSPQALEQSDVVEDEEEEIIAIKAPKQKKMKVFEVQNEPRLSRQTSTLPRSPVSAGDLQENPR